jgi:hypothetical protein
MNAPYLRIVDTRPNLYDSAAERERIDRINAETRDDIRKLRIRAAIEIAVMFAVAVVIGVMLAEGHS